MPRTLSQDSTGRKYPRALSVRIWYQALTGSKTDGAAHQRALRLEAAWRQYLFALRLAGRKDILARCLAMTQMECEEGPVQPIRLALLQGGHANRREDAARDAAALGDMTDAELIALDRAVDHDNAANLQIKRSIRAERELRQGQG